MTVRDSFEARFGADQADAIVAAAEGHHPGDNRGSDPFKWAALIALGFQCVERYADSHGITVTNEEFREWCVADGDLGTHDGDFDYLAAFVGTYEFLRDPEPAS
jgi:hypothetical protein